MSNLRERARELREHGEAERGDFTPSGAPLRMYKYWAEHSSRVPERENFCHYWRVVAFWGPFMFFKNKAVNFFSSNVGMATVVIAFVAAMLLLAFSGTDVAALGVAMLVVPYTFLGMFAGIIRANEGFEESWEYKAFWATIPISGPTYGIARMCLAIKAWPYDRKQLAGAVIGWSLGSLLALAAVGFVIFLFVTLGWLTVLVWTAVIAVSLGLAMLAILGIIVGLSALADLVAGRRREARLRAVENAPEPKDTTFEEPLPKVPGRFSKFMTALGDILIFVGQVIRVKKWKICPIVNVEVAE